MKAIVFHAISDVRLEDVPEPKIQEPTDAIVKLTSSHLRYRPAFRPAEPSAAWNRGEFLATSWPRQRALDFRGHVDAALRIAEHWPDMPDLMTLNHQVTQSLGHFDLSALSRREAGKVSRPGFHY